MDSITRNLRTKFRMNRAISYRRTVVPNLWGLFFKCFFKNSKVHLKFETQKSASVSIRSHDKGAVHKFRMNRAICIENTRANFSKFIFRKLKSPLKLRNSKNRFSKLRLHYKETATKFGMNQAICYRRTDVPITREPVYLSVFSQKFKEWI